MKIGDILNKIKSFSTVEVEGYFVERFINLCNIGKINIWNVETQNPGKIRFRTTPKDIKKMEQYLKRTKCKLSVVENSGIYYKIIKYKKRRIALISIVVLAIAIYVLSTFVWSIKIEGNNVLSVEQIKAKLKEIEIYEGKSKVRVSENKISDYLRSEFYEVAWVGAKIKGTTLNIQIVEKVISEQAEENKVIGDIIATKDAVITKIVANKGTAKYKVGSYITCGSVAIEGKSYINGELKELVHASGCLRGETEYVFTKEYPYTEILKKYGTKTNLGITLIINNKKIDIKYLPKGNKYDISSEEKVFKIFGNDFGIAFNKYTQYEEYEKSYTKDEIIQIASNDALDFLEEIKNRGGIYKSEIVSTEEKLDSIVYNVVYTIEEDIGKFTGGE